MSEAGMETSFSSRKRIAFALGSVLGCVKGKITDDLFAVAIEIPLYYLMLAQTRPKPKQRRSGVLSIFFSIHPLADVRRTVLKLHAFSKRAGDLL
jgi:hypothetical protein